jgi:Bacterial virulence factor lipase N-terminal
MSTRTRPWRPHVEILEDRCTPSTFAAFDLDAPERAPFPSDRFTVADSSQLTDRRINLPLPDAAARPSDYADLSIINTLDGFNLQPRLSIAFSSPIDVSTVTSNSVFLIKLEDPTSPDEPDGRIVGINQIVWDVATNTLHVESDELLEQHTRYALIVTRGVHDVDGQPVEPSAEFESFRHDLNFGQTYDAALKEYRKNLLGALKAARAAGVAEQDIVTASVFTTMSTTALLEKIRDQVHASTPAAADFLLGPDGTRTVFELSAVTGITFGQQTRVTGSLTNVAVPIGFLSIIPGSVGTVAFGKYTSPDYQVHSGEYIPPVGTRTGTPAVQRMNDVYFNVFLPSGLEPAGGWPVALFAHGTSGHKNEEPLRVAASNAAHGIATIAINLAGNGFGPLSTLTVNQIAGGPVTFLAGGRSVDQNGDGIIGGTEGQLAASPRTIIGETDALKQTTADLMQLVRVIQVGMDVDGHGARDLDPSRISYLGFSLGASLGTMLFAVEPNLRAAALNNPSGSRIEVSRLGTRRADIGALLAARTPSLINSPGVTAIGGLNVAGPHFNENMPLRDGLPLTVRLADGTTQIIQSPVVNTVAGAMEIQQVFEWREWVSQTGNPVAYAPHLREDPLPGVRVRPVLFQFAVGDETAPNPTNAAILRAGDLADRATIFRNDLAFAEDPAAPKNPHAFLVRIDSADPLVRQIALGAQDQLATFLASEGAVIIHPEPSKFFEDLLDLALLEDLDYIP